LLFERDPATAGPALDASPRLKKFSTEDGLSAGPPYRFGCFVGSIETLPGYVKDKRIDKHISGEVPIEGMPVDVFSDGVGNEVTGGLTS
jgi:hypothetical protein